MMTSPLARLMFALSRAAAPAVRACRQRVVPAVADRTGADRDQPGKRFCILSGSVQACCADGSWSQLAASGQAGGTGARRTRAIHLARAASARAVAAARAHAAGDGAFFRSGRGGIRADLVFSRTAPRQDHSCALRYVGGVLQIEPPDAVFSIRASWVLWPQEDGIRPIRLPLRFEHRQPPARRIDWLGQGKAPVQARYRRRSTRGDPAPRNREGLHLATRAGRRPAGQGAARSLAQFDAEVLRCFLDRSCNRGGPDAAAISAPAAPERNNMMARTDLRGALLDGLFVLAAGALVANTLGVTFLNSPNWPTGGDSASHLLYAWLYADSLLQSGKVLPWLPEVFGGLPFLSYYFPLPFIVIALLSKLIGVASAFKWGAFLAAMLLPGAVFVASRRWLGMSWPAALFGGVGALAFLLHEQNSIWGGNLLSTLAGEFAYSYGLCLAVLTMIAWLRAVHIGPRLDRRGIARGGDRFLARFSAAAGRLFHRVPAVRGRAVLPHRGFAAARPCARILPARRVAVADAGNARPHHSQRRLLSAGGLARFVAGHAVAGGGRGTRWSVRCNWFRPCGAAGLRCRRARCAISSAARGSAALAFLAGDQLGLADIRFFPLVWLCAAIVCGWLFGQALAAIGDAWQPKRQHRAVHVRRRRRARYARLARAARASGAGLGAVEPCRARFQTAVAQPDRAVSGHVR